MVGLAIVAAGWTVDAPCAAVAVLVAVVSAGLAALVRPAAARAAAVAVAAVARPGGALRLIPGAATPAEGSAGSAGARLAPVAASRWMAIAGRISSPPRCPAPNGRALASPMPRAGPAVQLGRAGVASAAIVPSALPVGLSTAPSAPSTPSAPPAVPTRLPAALCAVFGAAADSACAWLALDNAGLRRTAAGCEPCPAGPELWAAGSVAGEAGFAVDGLAVTGAARVADVAGFAVAGLVSAGFVDGIGVVAAG